MQNWQTKQEKCQRESKTKKQSSSPKSSDSSPKTDTMILSPTKESLHSNTQSNTMEVKISGVSSCEVSAILSVGKMDDINKSLEDYLADFVQVFTTVETADSLVMAAKTNSASSSIPAETTTSSVSEPSDVKKTACNCMASSGTWFPATLLHCQAHYQCWSMERG